MQSIHNSGGVRCERVVKFNALQRILVGEQCNPAAALGVIDNGGVEGTEDHLVEAGERPGIGG